MRNNKGIAIAFLHAARERCAQFNVFHEVALVRQEARLANCSLESIGTSNDELSDLIKRGKSSPNPNFYYSGPSDKPKYK